VPKITINFRELSRSGGSMVDRIDEHALGSYEAAEARNCQVSRGILEKSPGWMRLTGLTPTGYALSTDGQAATGAYFPDHADYDLGKRWTIDITVKPASLLGTQPIFWRADTSNAKITALELLSSGKLQFTHLDDNDDEVVLTSPHALSISDVAHVRVQRYKNELRMFLGLSSGYWRSVTSTAVDADYDTKPSSTPFYLNVSTITNGATVTGVVSFNGTVDEFRIYRDELRDGDPFALTETPWLADERMVLCARLNNDSLTDYSGNGNDGSALLDPSESEPALVEAMAPILAEWHLRTSAGLEQWLAWSNGGMYAVSVQ